MLGERLPQTKGKRTPGIDGKTVRGIQQELGEAKFLEGIRQELRCGSYTPSPSRRKLIPKTWETGGVPTLGNTNRKRSRSAMRDQADHGAIV